MSIRTESGLRSLTVLLLLLTIPAHPGRAFARQGDPVTGPADHHMQDGVFRRVQVSERVWALYGRGGNIGVVVTGEGVVVIDTQFADIAPGAVEQIRAITDEPIRYIVNTHVHGDHVGGNPVFQEYGDVVAQQNTWERMRASWKGEGAPHRGDGLPQISFDDDLRFHLGGTEIELIHLSRGHTDTDVVVWIPSEDVIHMGDLLFNHLVPVVDVGNGAHTGQWLQFLAGVSGRLGPDTRVIPGHGEVGGPSALQDMAGFLRAVHRVVEEGHAARRSRDEVLASPLSSLGEAFADWGGEGRLRRALEAAWIEQVGGERTLLVVNKSEDTLAFVDVATGNVRGRVGTGPNPHEVAVTHDGKTAFISNYGSGRPAGTRCWLTVVDVAGMRAVREIELRDPASGEYLSAPHGIMISADGRDLWVTTEGSRAVARIALPEEAVVSVYRTAQNTSHQVVPLPDGSKAYVSNIGSGSVSVLHRDSGEVVTIPTRPGTEGIDVSPDGRQVWATNREDGTISVIDTATDAVIATLPAGDTPIRVKFTPDGRYALVSNAGDDGIAVYDAATREQTATIETGGMPVGLLILPDGKRAYVANTLSDRVSVLDLVTWKVIGTIKPGDEPDGLALAIAR